MINQGVIDKNNTENAFSYIAYEVLRKQHTVDSALNFVIRSRFRSYKFFLFQFIHQQKNEQLPLVAQLVKNLPVIQETRFNSWVGKNPWRRDRLHTPVFLGFPGCSDGKESMCIAGDLGWEDPLEEGTATHSSILEGASLIPQLVTNLPAMQETLVQSPGEGKGYPRQYYGLENSMDCIVHAVPKTWT